MEITWEALEDACINPQDLQDTRTGVFAGAWTQEYKDSLISDLKDKGLCFRAYMGNSFGTCKFFLFMINYKQLN
jgi:acyl transferase domain-containing protein